MDSLTLFYFIYEEANDELTKVEITFPITELNKLEEMISRTRWVVPVLPDGELITLLEASIKLGQQNNILLCSGNAVVNFNEFISPYISRFVG